MVRVIEDFYPVVKYLKLVEPSNTKVDGQKTINVNCKTHNGNSQIHIVTKFPLMGIL